MYLSFAGSGLPAQLLDASSVKVLPEERDSRDPLHKDVSDLVDREPD